MAGDCPNCEASERVKVATQEAHYRADKARVAAEEHLQREHELGYVEGVRRAYLTQLKNALAGALGTGPMTEEPLIAIATLVSERAETIATLRRLLHELGDDDWPDALHLSDIIEKRLVPALERA